VEKYPVKVMKVKPMEPAMALRDMEKKAMEDIM